MARQTGGRDPKGNPGGGVIKDAFNVNTKTLEASVINPSSYDTDTANTIEELKSLLLEVINNAKGS